ncbi:hypothetical protein DFH08DRAFT_977151 [Mycena albidolilacea]|uniref:Uncharacterized protein n=1 Tax=Mycena albidolilacea TaxID=1033008 RepID=A0AAD6Z128_9AGAR|nr:hypothetical protein DFH08DRAFT_977151 [Mycena albidolilacea]
MFNPQAQLAQILLHCALPKGCSATNTSYLPHRLVIRSPVTVVVDILRFQSTRDSPVLKDILHDATRLNATPNNLPRSIAACSRLKCGARRTHLGAAAIIIVDICLIRSETTLVDSGEWNGFRAFDLFERAAFENVPTVPMIRANAYSHGLRIGDTE